MVLFRCQCGKTVREGAHPFRCETCPECGSQILAEGEEYDTPLDHVLVERHENGNKFMQCKRCGYKPE